MDERPPEEGYFPISEFGGESQDWINGAQIGQLMSDLGNRKTEVVRCILSTHNEGYLERIGLAYGRRYRILASDSASDTIFVEFDPPTEPNISDALEHRIE